MPPRIGEEAGQHGHGGRRDQCRADSLGEAGRDQDGGVRRGRCGPRCGGEDDQPGGEQRPPAEPVGQTAAEQQQTAEGQPVRRADQHEA
jgi:hypothetical protein